MPLSRYPFPPAPVLLPFLSCPKPSRGNIFHWKPAKIGIYRHGWQTPLLLWYRENVWNGRGSKLHLPPESGLPDPDLLPRLRQSVPRSAALPAASSPHGVCVPGVCALFLRVPAVFPQTAFLPQHTKLPVPNTGVPVYRISTSPPLPLPAFP